MGYRAATVLFFSMYTVQKRDSSRQYSEHESMNEDGCKTDKLDEEDKKKQISGERPART